MFTVKRDFYFEAAHHIPNHPSECAQLHGHRWKVTISLSTKKQNEGTGISIDFKEIKDSLEPFIMKYDHKYLNNFFDQPSAENIAYTIFQEVKKHLHEHSTLTGITVREGRDTEVTYYE